VCLLGLCLGNAVLAAPSPSPSAWSKAPIERASAKAPAERSSPRAPAVRSSPKAPVERSSPKAPAVRSSPKAPMERAAPSASPRAAAERPSPEPSRADPLPPGEALTSAMDMEVSGKDMRQALALYRQAQAAPPGDVHDRAMVGTARVLLRLEEWKELNQLLQKLTTRQNSESSIGKEVAFLKKLRDEQQRELRRAPATKGYQKRADVSLSDATLEEALSSLSSLYGATIVSAPLDYSVNLKLRGVSLHQALIAVVFQCGVSARRAGTAYYVGTAQHLAAILPRIGSHSIEELFVLESAPRQANADTTMSLRFQNQEVAEVIRRLSDSYGANIVAVNTTARVSMELTQVGLDGALRALSSQLHWEIRHSRELFFLGPEKQLAMYFPGFERRYLALHHALAGDIYDDIQEFQAKEGLRVTRTEVDVAGNGLLVEGERNELNRLEQFLARLDVPEQRLSLDVMLRDRAGLKTEESPRKRVRILNGQMGSVTLEAPSAVEPSQGEQVQLMVDFTPRLRASDQVSFDLHWRLTFRRGGVIKDVREGTVIRVATKLDQPLEIPIIKPEPGAQRELTLVLQPER
jgi:hypothetical protein